MFGASEGEALPVVVFATCVAEKAKKRNIKVPTNSPIIAIKWFLTLFGIQLIPRSRRSRALEACFSTSRIAFFFHLPGITIYLSDGGLMFMVADGEGMKVAKSNRGGMEASYVCRRTLFFISGRNRRANHLRAPVQPRRENDGGGEVPLMQGSRSRLRDLRVHYATVTRRLKTGPRCRGSFRPVLR